MEKLFANIIDHNEVEELEVAETVKSIAKISARSNHLHKVRIGSVSLKILHLERNPMLKIDDYRMFQHLDTFSLEISGAPPLTADDLAALSDVSHLKLVGSSTAGTSTVTSFPIHEPFLNLRKLDLAGLGLEGLPREFGHYAINLRELNLAFNKISDLTPLQAIPKLGHVFLYKNKVESIKTCLDFVSHGSRDLELLDLRDNPLTDGFYPDINSTLRNWPQGGKDLGKSKEPRVKWYQKSLSRNFQEFWVESDANHARDMERYDMESFHKRVGYQGLLVSAATELKWLDGTIMTPEKVTSIKRHWGIILTSAKNKPT